MGGGVMEWMRWTEWERRKGSKKAKRGKEAEKSKYDDGVWEKRGTTKKINKSALCFCL